MENGKIIYNTVNSNKQKLTDLSIKENGKVVKRPDMQF